MTAIEESRYIATLAATKDYLFLRHVSWPSYQALLEAWDDKTQRHTFLQGSLEITVRSREHEVFKTLLGMFLAILFEECNVAFAAGGEMTLTREDLERGIEPDQCFWIQNEARVRGKRTLDFTVDPPPDLFVEIEVSRTILDRLSILATLRVPEVWRFDGSSLTIGLLQSDGQYLWQDRSLIFPGFDAKEISRFLRQAADQDHLTVLREFRTWVKQQLGKPQQ